MLIFLATIKNNYSSSQNLFEPEKFSSAIFMEFKYKPVKNIHICTGCHLYSVAHVLVSYKLSHTSVLKQY